MMQINKYYIKLHETECKAYLGQVFLKYPQLHHNSWSLIRQSFIAFPSYLEEDEEKENEPA